MSLNAAKTQERIDHPTPNGGEYSIAYYRDAEGLPTAKQSAVSAEIVEFDSFDRQIFRTYMQSESAISKQERRYDALGILIE
ncbi:MAG: hypothetical protein HLUCCA11_19450 [Phormidesmis priestleyi Ana]|uniref:Uncharacterized protein n=1 Tax=Phormidesmis priestleyi Ana TaxID=1666911 RepID=A0A0P7YS29_9CYAN|nr:MAG: hypothetical protein HLUCCA11_19450 [Phormidesmis priestleyi Ana]